MAYVGQALTHKFGQLHVICWNRSNGWTTAEGRCVLADTRLIGQAGCIFQHLSRFYTWQIQPKLYINMSNITTNRTKRLMVLSIFFSWFLNSCPIVRWSCVFPFICPSSWQLAHAMGAAMKGLMYSFLKMGLNMAAMGCICASLLFRGSMLKWRAFPSQVYSILPLLCVLFPMVFAVLISTRNLF